MIKTTFKIKYYDDKDAIRILNPKQSAFYWSNGVEPLDIYPSKNHETNEPVIVYIFSRSETQETGVYDEWCNKKKKNNEEGIDESN